VSAEPAGPALLGRLYEAGLAPRDRAAGAHYTPVDLAARLVGLADAPGPDRAPPGQPRVWDPACGGGAFLLAAADALIDAGYPPGLVVEELLWGSDVDEGAVAITEASLCWWAQRHGVDARPGPHLAVADALLGPVCPVGSVRPGGSVDPAGPAGPLAVAAEAGFDLVVGNPPFQGQLTGSTVRAAAATAALRERLGPDVVGPYTDAAALFLVAGIRSLALGGRLVMILPTSVLSARDAEATRRAVSEVASLTGLWMAGERVFDADVEVCALVCERPRPDEATPGAHHPVVRRWRGRSVTALPDSRSDRSSPDDERWSVHVLAAIDVPDPAFRSAGTVAEVASARAGFRDEYYGLVGHVREGPAAGVVGADAEAVEPASIGLAGDPVDDPINDAIGELPMGLAPLVTSGLIGPGCCWWGRRSARFAKVSYQRPVVSLASVASVGGRVARWVVAQQVPKVVVATQTRVGEAAVDEEGRWVASTPTVAVTLAREPAGVGHDPRGARPQADAEADALWLVAAVVCSPIGSVAALAATAGSGRTTTAIKHSVTSVLALPLPVDADAWQAGADALRCGDREGFAAAMAAAYAVADPAELNDWWQARAPWPS
jgi:hypothetical protein